MEFGQTDGPSEFISQDRLDDNEVLIAETIRALPIILEDVCSTTRSIYTYINFRKGVAANRRLPSG